MDKITKEFTCVDCGEEGLVFEGFNEYEPDEETGEKRCWTCDMKANPKKEEEI